MDVKNVFLNGHELVFVKQTLEFENPKFSNHVYKLDKALCGLKQATLIRHSNRNGTIDKEK
jgi:hypothetical protein